MSSLFLDRSIPELVRDIQNGSLRCEDLAATTIQMVDAHERRTRAWTRFNPEQLLADARATDERTPVEKSAIGLPGIPIGVKDIFNTRAFPTEMGSPVWKGFTPGNNARVVDKILRAGALVAGKTVTAEFAVHALNETLNPHDPTKTPGTSTSGSAAAVAVGMVPAALGTQTAGSIIRPASFCGIWGMKPSFGLIPRTGVLKTTDSLDTIGFVASRANSLRPLLDNLRVTGPDYPFVYRRVDAGGNHPKSPGRPWVVGLVRTYTWQTAADYAKRAVEDLANRIGGEPDFDVEELELPAMLEQAHEVHSRIYTKSLAYYFQEEAKRQRSISPIMRQMIEEGRAISADMFHAALQKQEDMCGVLDELLGPYDMVISLGTASVAPERGREELPDPSLIWTLGHLPSIAAPAFRGPENLPFGVQLISRRWNDYLLLQGVELLASRAILPPGSQPITVTVVDQG